jgi:hypothetical protein
MIPQALFNRAHRVLRERDSRDGWRACALHERNPPYRDRLPSLHAPSAIFAAMHHERIFHHLRTPNIFSPIKIAIHI